MFIHHKAHRYNRGLGRSAASDTLWKKQKLRRLELRSDLTLFTLHILGNAASNGTHINLAIWQVKARGPNPTQALNCSCGSFSTVHQLKPFIPLDYYAYCEQGIMVGFEKTKGIISLAWPAWLLFHTVLQRWTESPEGHLSLSLRPFHDPTYVTHSKVTFWITVTLFKVQV